MQRPLEDATFLSARSLPVSLPSLINFSLSMLLISLLFFLTVSWVDTSAFLAFAKISIMMTFNCTFLASAFLRSFPLVLLALYRNTTQTTRFKTSYSSALKPMSVFSSVSTLGAHVSTLCTANVA